MKPIVFKKALADADKFIISPGCKTENSGYMSMYRVDRKSVPDGWYAYDVRGLNSPQTIENFVFVNHYGTFLTQKPIDFKGKEYRSLNGRGGYTYA